MNVENNSLISALVECDTSLNEGRVDFQTAMQRLGMESVFDIIQMAPSEFAQRLSAHSDADPDLAYKNATRYASLIGRLYREYKTSSPNVPQLARRTGIHSLTGDGPTWQSQFMEDWDSFVSVGAMAAIDSPVAYLAALWTFVQQLEATRHSDDPIDPLRILLDKRRPDLKTLLITRENTYTSRPMLEIVTQVLTTNLLDDLQAVPADKNKSIYQVLSERRFPFQLPYNFYHHQCQLGMAGNKPRLGELNYRVSRRLPIGQMPDNQYGKVRDTDLQAQQLLSGLSPEQQKLLCETCDIHLTRQDLIDGWVGIGSTHPPASAAHPYCYIVPLSQADVGTVVPQANIPTAASHGEKNVVPVTFRKGDQTKIVNLALSSSTLDGNDSELVNRIRAGANTPFVLKINADEELPEEIDEGFTASFNVLTVASPDSAPVELERHSFTLTLDDTQWTTSDLDDFMHRSDLKAEQVEQLLGRQRYSVRLSPNCPGAATKRNRTYHRDSSKAGLPVSPSIYGARYVNGGDGVASSDDAMDLEQVESPNKKSWRLTGTSGDRFKRLQRMIRLQRWTGMRFAHLDTLVMSVIHAEGADNTNMALNNNTLRALGVYHYLNQRYTIAPEEFAALLHLLASHASGEGAVSLFDQVFNQELLFDTPLILDDTVITLPATDAETQKTLLQLCAGLDLQPTDDSLLLLLKQTKQYVGTLKRDLWTVTSLYRQARIAQLFGYPVADLLTLAGLLGGSVYKRVLAGGGLRPVTRSDTPDILDVLMQLAWAVEWLKESQQTVAQLQARLGPYVPLATADQAQGSATETADQYPPLPDDLSKRLSRLQDDTRRSVVTAEHVAALGLPPHDDATPTPAVLKWHDMLVTGNLINIDGLLPGLDQPWVLVEEPITWLAAEVDKLLAALNLSAEVKQTCKDKLVGLLLSAHDKQVQLLEQLFQETAKLPQDRTVAVLSWARSSVYNFLLDALEEASPRLIEQFQRVSQYAEIIVHLRLSNSALRLFLINPDWLGANQYEDSYGEPTLASLYLLESFSRWLHAQGESEDTVLSYFPLANPSKRELKNKALRKAASETANSALAHLLGWSLEEVTTITDTLEAKRACSMEEVDWVRRCQATCLASGLSAKTLLQATHLNRQSNLDAWKVVGHAVMASEAAAASRGLDVPLNESLRDAMVALYLHEAVPRNAYLVEKGLTDNIKTADDLYEYWLLDVLVSQNVPTSPVACAIASLQQLINAIMLNMEPGYRHVSIDPSQKQTWFDGLNRYPIWAAMQQLHYFPDIYLDPNLRRTKTASFEQLENDINQARIEPETVRAAVLAYLARFEEVSNVQVCNGYIDGENFANNTYYFIGKSLAENSFFWRSLDMSQRAEHKPTATGIAPKLDKPLPEAWTDWKRANVPISEKALAHTIRPCWFNNRLFIIWAEIEYQDPNAIATVAGAKAENTITLHPRFRLYGSYKKYDDNWSTPRVYVESYCKTPALIAKTPEEIAAQTHTIAVYNHWNTPESMFLALYSNYTANEDATGAGDEYDFLRTVRIDKNFNVMALYPESGHVGINSEAPLLEDDDSKKDVQLIGRIFARDNAGRFQYRLPTRTNVFGDVADRTPTGASRVWNYGGWQSRIKPSIKDVDVFYNRTTSKVELTVRLAESFLDATMLTMFFFDRSTPQQTILTLRLVYHNADLQNQKAVELLEGSSITAHGTTTADFFKVGGDYVFDGYRGYVNSFIKDADSQWFSLPGNPDGTEMSLNGKIADSEILKAIPLLDTTFYDNMGRYFQVLRHTVNGVSKELDFSATPLKNTVILGAAYRYKLFISHPYKIVDDQPATFEEMHTLMETEFKDHLAKDSWLKLEIPIDQTTFHPGWDGAWPAPEEVKIPLIYGVVIAVPMLGSWTPTGGALRALTVGWGAQAAGPLQTAPSINDLEYPSIGDSAPLGKAQFISFNNSSIPHSEVKPEDDAEFPPREPNR